MVLDSRPHVGPGVGVMGLRPRVRQLVRQLLPAQRASTSSGSRDGGAPPGRRAAAGRRQHDHAATRAQALPDGRDHARARIQEALLAIQIEKRYLERRSSRCPATRCPGARRRTASKPHPALTSASHVKDLTLDEARDDRGHSPEQRASSPYNNTAAARTRRNYALERMAVEGYITAEEAPGAKCATHRHAPASPRRVSSIAPYFLEAIRTQLEEQYGAKAPSTKTASRFAHGLEPGAAARGGPGARQAASEGESIGVAVTGNPAQNVITEKKSIDSLPASSLDSRARCSGATSCRRW